MLKALIIATSLMLAGAAGGELETHNGVVYKPNESVPYSGAYSRRLTDGRLINGGFKDGKPEGFWRMYCVTGRSGSADWQIQWERLRAYRPLNTSPNQTFTRSPDAQHR
jgi:hypothetical protein